MPPEKVLSVAAIEVKGLEKSYGSFKALDGLSFKVEEYEKHGFLGPNGAGKTTTVRTIMGLLQPDSGDIMIYGDGSEKKDFRTMSRVGYMPERASSPPHLTGKELLDIYGQIYDMAEDKRKYRAEELLELVGLSNYMDKKIKTFSKGMKQRLGIAQSLISDPDLLILDEPTSGLDPSGRVKVREIIEKVSEKEITLFISSHLLEEIERTCERITIIDEGKCVASESMKKLAKKQETMVLRIEIAGLDEEIVNSVKELTEVNKVERNKDILKVFVDIGSDPRILISKTITEAGGSIVGMAKESRTLEDVFLELTRGESENDQLR